MKHITYFLLQVSLLPFSLRRVFAVGSGSDQPGSGRAPGDPSADSIIEFKSPTENEDLLCFIDHIANVFAFQIAPIIVVTMILYGAFRMLTAAGDPEAFAVGKKTIVYSVLGYIIVLLIAGVVDIRMLFNDIFDGNTQALDCRS
ncbi:MAG: hypothetical protein A3H06_00825 [Candidatus Colwellbacteria bacterium RIFCSPLOWO2_12_FULL_44_13]|uniref:Uncharacterized protein n=2 Tax=Candidatus Colwelliibacteriota TaxID=1817904 RepID=A0A1G1Z4Z6_9BACT|nr:MAG: hypothetical protein A3F24_00055 [Candidatus Colwellbacteria bacterium RIFCSPHIGHO2_12_FULL_44_17]OGY61397.1 MAG: hypothetical protein A3H06_00825 [Candidatus Colwellbacteria bacterium RIFCSPLOWO2_12_FULL_44_13]